MHPTEQRNCPTAQLSCNSPNCSTSDWVGATAGPHPSSPRQSS